MSTDAEVLLFVAGMLYVGLGAVWVLWVLEKFLARWDTRPRARFLLATPVWPLMVLIFGVRGLVNLIRTAFGKD